MRILIFSELFYPHGGGAELATWLYSKLFAEHGFKVTVITSQFLGEDSIEILGNGITIYRVPIRMALGNRYGTLSTVGALASSWLNNLIKNCDAVYVPCYWYSAILLAKVHKKPVIVHLHNYSIACPTSLMYNFVEQRVGSSSIKSFILHEKIERRRSLSSVVVSSLINESFGKFYNKMSMLADVIIFVSNAQRDLTLLKIPNLKEKSHVIYNPIPDIPFVKADSKGVGYFGGRSFVKGFHVIVQALKSVHNMNGVETYLAMTSKEHVKITLCNGIKLNLLPKINLDTIMRRLSVIVTPSLCPEPSPYTLIESMLYGKLVIASHVGGIPDLLDEVSGGRLIKPGDYIEIADKLDSFIALPLEEANELGLKNRKYILDKFENDRTILSFIKILDKVSVS